VFTLLLVSVTGVHFHFSIFAKDMLSHPFENVRDLIIAGVEKVLSHGLSVIHCEVLISI
jgi:hypothetical protein